MRGFLERISELEDSDTDKGRGRREGGNRRKGIPTGTIRLRQAYAAVIRPFTVLSPLRVSFVRSEQERETHTEYFCSYNYSSDDSSSSSTVEIPCGRFARPPHCESTEKDAGAGRTRPQSHQEKERERRTNIHTPPQANTTRQAVLATSHAITLGREGGRRRKKYTKRTVVST